MSGGLIYQYNAVSEHAELLSTSPSRRCERRRMLQRGVHPMAISPSFSRTQSDWNKGTLPPLEDIKLFIRRLQSTGNVSQSSVFKTSAAPLLLLAFLAIGVMALQPHSVAHHVLAAPRDHPRELLKGILTVLAGCCLGLITLRALIWLVAVGIEMSFESNDRNGPATTVTPPGIREGPNDIGALVSGIFR